MAYRNHMEKHEKHCTMNPNRECRLCEIIGESPRPMAELLAVVPRLAYYDYGVSPYPDYAAYEKATIAALPKLRELTNNCPACILAALRQAKNTQLGPDHFDFFKESKAFLKENNNPNEGIGY